MSSNLGLDLHLAGRLMVFGQVPWIACQDLVVLNSDVTKRWSLRRRHRRLEMRITPQEEVAGLAQEQQEVEQHGENETSNHSEEECPTMGQEVNGAMHEASPFGVVLRVVCDAICSHSLRGRFSFFRFGLAFQSLHGRGKFGEEVQRGTTNGRDLLGSVRFDTHEAHGELHWTDWLGFVDVTRGEGFRATGRHHSHHRHLGWWHMLRLRERRNWLDLKNDAHLSLLVLDEHGTNYSMVTSHNLVYLDLGLSDRH